MSPTQRGVGASGTGREEVNEIERIQDQLQRAFEGKAWHGPSVREVLADVTPPQAAWRPIPDAHSIWEIVLHITFWEAVVEARVRGAALEATPERDWPEVTDSSERAWRASLESLERGHRKLRATVAKIDAARLPERIGTRSTIYSLLHGIVQHDLYHAGQIAVLKKAIVKKAVVKSKKAGKRRGT